MMVTFKNYKESEILTYLQAHKLTCHRFMDADRRHKTLGSEKKGSLLLTTVTLANV